MNLISLPLSCDHLLLCGSSKGGVEDERVLLSLGGKKCATVMELESTLCFLSSHQEKRGEEDLILT